MSGLLAPADWAAIGLTLRLAMATTVLLLLVALPLAWWLAGSASRWRAPVAALVTLPLVLPPTVLGFYLLVLMGPDGPLGQLTQGLGWGLLSFTFTGLLIGSVVYSLPFAVQPLRDAFEAAGKRPLEVAQTLGATPCRHSSALSCRWRGRVCSPRPCSPLPTPSASSAWC